MTRFARASGSKGSNEKRPEDATSWQEMKTSMVTKTGKKKKDSVTESQEQEPEEATTWQEMKTAMSSKVDNEKKDDSEEDADVPSTEEIQNVWAQLVNESDQKNKKKKKTDVNTSTEKKEKKKKSDVNTSTEKKEKKVKDDQPKPSKKKRAAEENNEQETHVKQKVKNDQPKPSKKKRAAEENNDQETRLKKKVKKLKPEPQIPQENPNGPEKKKGIELLVKDTAGVEKKEKKRRKEALKPAELMINGKPVKVAPFDGFIVQADDAARLRELRKSMKSKGIPEDERERAIKLERRRAEKALARLRKKVCFHCRSTGHNLSECPQIESEQRATGICYKCGSTEHTHFQCKVTRGDDYKFAECFICKEQGHISKQCPDNPRGLYPRGGGCASCGDVTHLKKDCPKYLAEKEDDVTVNTRNDRSLEALEEDLQVKKSTPFRGKKLNKRIKF